MIFFKTRVISAILAILYLICTALAVEFDDKNSAYPAIWHVPHRNENFIGRSNELKDMANYFQEADSKILPLTGRGGIGKTQLAKQYTHLYKQSYDIVWWFDVKKDLVVQIKELAEALNASVIPSQRVNLSYKKDEAIVAYVKDQLRTNEKNWLLIFDDTKDIQGILAYLPDQHASSKGHIIITSRNNWAGYKTIKLTEFLRRDSMQLINGFLSNERQSEKEKLAGLFGDYPLAIVQAISYIKAVPSLSIADYLQLYNSERVKLWEKEQQILAGAGNMNTTDNYNESTAVTLSMTMQEIGSKNEQALKLLKFCSMLDNENIPLSIMRHYITDQLVLNEAIAILINHNVMELKSKTQSGDILYRMHEMVQLVVQDKMTIKEKKEYLEKMANSLSAILPTKTDELCKVISLNPYYLYNVERIVREAESIRFFNDAVMTVNIRHLELVLRCKRDYPYAKKIIEDIYSILKSHKEVLLSNINMASLYLRHSFYVASANLNYQESIELAVRAYRLLVNNKDEEEKYLLLMAYNLLVQYYYFLGQLDNALHYSNMATVLINQYQGTIANEEIYYHARSRILIDKGQLKEAALLAQKALDIALKNSKSVEDMEYFPVHVLQCQVLLKLDKPNEVYDKALEMYHAAEKFYDGQHQFLVMASALLADAANRLGNLSIAEEKINKAIELHAKSYGKGVQNRYTAYIRTVRGDIYAKQNKYDEAEEEYLKAEEIYKSVLKNIKIDDVSSLYIKISINAAKRKDHLVTKYYFDLHKETFGEEHQRNFELIMYLTKNRLPMP